MLAASLRSALLRRPDPAPEADVSGLVRSHVGTHMARPSRPDAYLAYQLLVRAKAAARAGDQAGAHALLLRALDHDSGCAEAWLWLGAVTDDEELAAACLETVLRLEPANEWARLGLRCLGRDPAEDASSAR